MRTGTGEQAARSRINAGVKLETVVGGNQVGRRKVGRAGAVQRERCAFKADQAALRRGAAIQKKQGNKGQSQHGSLR